MSSASKLPMRAVSVAVLPAPGGPVSTSVRIGAHYAEPWPAAAWDEYEHSRRRPIAILGGSVYGRGVMPQVRTKAQRRADRDAVGACHEQEQAKLLEHVREGFARWDAGAIDAFELDELVHHYHRSSQKLWSMCVGRGAQASQLARLLEWQAAEGELTDWWEAGASQRRRDP